MNKFILTASLALYAGLITASPAYCDESDYWNSDTKLLPLRLPPAPQGHKPVYIDLDGDGRPDAIRTLTHKGITVLWLDDDRNMKKGDTAGDTSNDCLLIDRNRDGFFGGHGDLIIDWVDENGDGKADMQIVIDYPEEGKSDGAHYMIIRDLDNDNIFNYINFNDFTLKCWDRMGLSDFYVDYSGQTLFMKIHRPTYELRDLRYNWENPFLFYDPDGDGLSEMAIRIVDSPKERDPVWTGSQLTGHADWVSIAVDIDNDNASGNDFDFDFTIGFQGPGFDYSDCVHPVRNLRGLPEADRFFLDPRYRQIDALIYPDHQQAWQKIFDNDSKWNRVNFVYDEDDDCSRWERVEFYDPLDPFKSGWKNGGIDNNKQSDAAGDRGEWDMDNSGGGRLYIGRFDGRMHLYGAETGVWRIDQNATWYQGWDRMWLGQDFYPRSFATVVYSDTDGNGFIDRVEYDLDGDTKYETVVDFKTLGIDDRCDLIDLSQFEYKDFIELSRRMSDGVWARAMKAVEIARQYGLDTSWYAKFMTASTDREKYSRGYWLAFYIYKDLENMFLSRGDADALADLNRAYYSGDWAAVALRGDDGFHFFSDDDIAAIRTSARTGWGRRIIKHLERQVNERRRHRLEVVDEPGGHYHDYFCPKHNLLLTFDWDKPKAQRCSACGEDYVGNARFDRAWIYQVHARNRDYMYNCAYLYLATGNARYATYIRDMLLDYASKYDGWFEHDSGNNPNTQHGGKAFAQSLDEANWATKVALAYDVIRHTLTDSEIKAIESGYLRPAARMLLDRPAGANWQMWHNSGLVALAVALRDDSIIDVAINDRTRGYHALIAKHKNSDGWINEGSPHYHYYPLEALIFTANAVRCRGIDLFDSDLHDMFAEPVKGTYPDMSFPAHSDGWYGANLLSQTALYELASARYRDPVLRDVLARSYARKERLDAEALANGYDIKPDHSADPIFKGSYAYKASGFCLLRSDARTVVLKFGGEGIGHGHPDKMSISIHDGRRELVSDFGTSGYGTPDYLQWYKRTLSHNTVTVDGCDQLKSRGSLDRFEVRADGGYAEMSSVDAYPSVEMRRSVDLSGKDISDVFTCLSDTQHIYEYVLIFNDRPQLEGNPSEVVLDYSEPHRRISSALSYPYIRGMVCRTKDLSVTLDVTDGEVLSMVLGEAPGIPSNPTVSDGPAHGDVAVKPCYPLILRIKGKDMKVNAAWKFAD